MGLGSNFGAAVRIRIEDRVVVLRLYDGAEANTPTVQLLLPGVRALELGAALTEAGEKLCLDGKASWTLDGVIAAVERDRRDDR
jgi:hypothetical protein